MQIAEPVSMENLGRQSHKYNLCSYMLIYVHLVNIIVDNQHHAYVHGEKLVINKNDRIVVLDYSVASTLQEKELANRGASYITLMSYLT